MQHKVIESTYRILGEAERPLLLHRTSQPCEGETTTPRPNSCWFPRDRDDRADDLWTVWNVVQENAIKGGLRGIGRDDLGRPGRPMLVCVLPAEPSSDGTLRGDGAQARFTEPRRFALGPQRARKMPRRRSDNSREGCAEGA